VGLVIAAHAAGLRNLDLVRHLLENDSLTRKPRGTQAAAFAVNDLRAVVRPELRENLARQDVAAVGPLVAQDAVEEKVVRRALAYADERREPPALPGDAFLPLRSPGNAAGLLRRLANGSPGSACLLTAKRSSPRNSVHQKPHS
jgi:hypothetical protein